MASFLIKYPFSTTFVVFIWIICLIPIPDNPLSEVHLIDKWTHIALYFVLSSIIGHEFFKAHEKTTARQLILWEWLLPIAMGGLIEIVQATCTNGVRSGEWLDFAADAIGATVALVCGIILAKIRG